MKNAIKLVKNINLSKPELILRSIPKHSEISAFADKYRNFLSELPKSIRRDDTRNFVKFPYRSFNLIPKEMLTKIIDESFQIIKQKVDTTNQATLYNAIMKTYMSNEINFDIKSLLQEMNQGNIPFNEETYHILIGIYCNCGEMSTVEYLINTMDKEKIELDQQDKLRIITGYIIAGQSSKSKTYIKENDLDDNNMGVLLSEGRGYASLGDIKKVMDIVNKLKDNNVELLPALLDFYRRLVTTEVTESELEQISNLFPQKGSNIRFLNLVFHLNRAGYFNKSLKLLENHKHRLSEFDASSLLTSFHSSECPINTYKAVLTLLMDRLTVSQKNLFSKMDYDEAIKYAKEVINDSNGNIICTSLQNRAIGEQSLSLLQDSLKFSVENLRPHRLNLQLQYGFIPTVLKSGMATKCSDILDMLPQYKMVLLPSMLMYNLCKGNFPDYNALLCYAGKNRNMFFKTNFRTISLEILKNVDMKELDKISTEASKIFDHIVVNNVLANVIVEAIVMQSASDSFDRIVEIVKLAERFDVTFKTIDIEKLKTSVPEHIELFQSLTNRISDIKTENKEPEVSSGSQ